MNHWRLLDHFEQKAGCKNVDNGPYNPEIVYLTVYYKSLEGPIDLFSPLSQYIRQTVEESGIQIGI